jgi:uncharacterized protein (UPF0147 family)
MTKDRLERVLGSQSLDVEKLHQMLEQMVLETTNPEQLRQQTVQAYEKNKEGANKEIVRCAEAAISILSSITGDNVGVSLLALEAAQRLLIRRHDLSEEYGKLMTMADSLWKDIVSGKFDEVTDGYKVLNVPDSVASELGKALALKSLRPEIDPDEFHRAKFTFGDVKPSLEVVKKMSRNDGMRLVLQHVLGNWGRVDDENDIEVNNFNMGADEGTIFSIHVIDESKDHADTDNQVYIITNPEHTETRVILPEEY